MKSISLLILSLVFVAELNAEQLLDRVVVSIEGEPITQSEITRFATAQGKDISSYAANSESFQSIVQEVVIQRLLNKEAEALNISVSNEEVEAYLGEIRRQNGVDESSFREVLAARGINWESYLAQVRTDIIKNRVVSARVRAAINVVDEDVKRFLDAQPQLKPEVGTRRVFEIELGFVPELAETKREELLKLLAEQEEFDALPLLKMGAKDLGYVASDELRDKISETLAETKDAQLSKVVNIDLRNVAYYVVSTISEDSPVDTVLAKEISAKVYEKKFNERLQEFIDVELPARYHVEQM